MSRAAFPGAALAQGAPRKGGTLRVSVDQAPGVLHPLLTRVNPEYMLSELLYSGLTRLGTDMTPEPDLAESWTPSPDVKEWTFTLRAGLKFHDGSPCTTKDVAATFKAILDPKTASPGRTNVGPIGEVVAQAPALLAIGLCVAANRLMTLAAAVIALGLLLFSGALAFHDLTGNAAFASIAPIGGTALIVGWLGLAAAAIAHRK